MDNRPRPRPITPAANSCSDCDAVDRRSFIRTVGATALAAGISPLLQSRLFAAPTPQSGAESVVGQLYQSLSDTQKKTIAFPIEHELRKKINANWQITKPRIHDDFYTDAQRALIEQIVQKVTTPEGFEKLKQQMEDDSGGIGDYSIALFGTPGSGAFEWELTGRHLTLRADGNTVDKAAFGGPIVYGHSAEDPKKNLFHNQTIKVNEVFKALDAKQAEQALIAKAPPEAAVQLQGASGKFPGLAVGELSSDQRTLFETTLKTLLATYRKEDVDEVFEVIKGGGGLEKLHLAYYRQEDIGNDKEWDIWRVEGPSLVWHFRGAPHVHAYINIGMVG